MPGEGIRRPPLLEKLAQGRLRATGIVEQGPRPAVEARNAGEHPQVAGIDDPAALREQPVQAARRVQEPAAPAVDRERHIGRVAVHPQLGEQPDEVGIGPVVVSRMRTQPLGKTSSSRRSWLTKEYRPGKGVLDVTLVEQLAIGTSKTNARIIVDLVDRDTTPASSSAVWLLPARQPDQQFMRILSERG